MITFILEFLDQVTVILAFGTGRLQRKEELCPTAHDHFWRIPATEEIGSNVVLFPTSTRMGRWCSIRNSRGRNHAVAHLLTAGEDFRCRFHLWVIEGIFGPIFVDTHGIDDGFIARHIGGHGVCRVRYNRVIAACCDKGKAWHLFHGKDVIEFSV